MAEDAQTSILGRRRPRQRGPLVVTNPGNDSDEEVEYGASRGTNSFHHPQPLSSPSTHSPHSEQSSLPSTSYTPKSNMNLPSVIPDQTPTYAARSNPSNPSLSSPSGSSSPAVESTPPPSTPGQSVPPMNPINDTANASAVDDKSDVRQKPLGARMSMMDRVKQHLPLLQGKGATNGRSATSPTMMSNPTNPPFTSPTFQSPREPISQKVLLTVTADCDNYTYLDVTGAPSAIFIREKIFSKLQIPDDQQVYFSIYRTEIGQFAMGTALTDERIMEICREEGDSKGSVKFLVQHTSAPVHLPRPLVPNHVPPVLPYQESFHSPSNKARSTKSAHDDRSSVGESFPVDPANGYEGSVSDDMDPYEKDKQRHTMRPAPQASTSSQSLALNPNSPLEQRRANTNPNVREPSPQSSARRQLSPLRTQPLDCFSPQSSSTLPDRGRGNAKHISQQSYSPNYQFFDDCSITPPSTRRTHNHSASDAAAERERVLEKSERSLGIPVPKRREEKPKQDPAKRRGKATDWPETSKMTTDPWVVVPHDRNALTDPNYASPSNPKPSMSTSTQGGTLIDPSRFNPYHPNPYSSRGNLPPIPNAPRQAPPPVPTSSNSYSRQHNQIVPKNWAIKFLGDSHDQRSQAKQTSSSHRLNSAKSMDNLRPTSHPNNLLSPRKAPPTLARPSMMGLKEAASASASASNTSFMNMDPPSSRRELSGLNSAGLPRSFEGSRGQGYSPTAYTRPQALQYQETNQSSQTQYRPLPSHSQSTNSNSGQFLSTTPWRVNEDMYPRPHSALEHIGASPAPPRPRPLPSTSGATSSFVDVEASFEDEKGKLTSPHHPFAAPGVRPCLNSLNSGSSRQNSTSNANTFNDDGCGTYNSSLDPSNLQNRSPHNLTSPDSPRRGPQDKLNGIAPSQSTDSNKSFVPLTGDSPVYDGDNEGTNSSTLKAEDHAWLLPVLDNNTPNEGTLRPGKPSRMQFDKPLPTVGSSNSSTLTKVDSIQTYRSSIIDDRDPDDEIDDDDDDDAGSLWKTPLKPVVKKSDAKPPVLKIDIDGRPANSPLTTTRSPYGLHGLPPNVPPPNFPPPPPPPTNTPQIRVRNPLRRAGGLKASRSEGSANIDGSKRDSQFINSSKKTWLYRPPADEVVNRLEDFFPDFDVDKPVIDTTSGGSSPTAVEADTPALQTNAAAAAGQRYKHKKSLRHVVGEHKKKVDGTVRSDSSTISSIMRKRSTKLWGSKVEEVTPSGIPPPVPESPTQANPKPIFKWVRGELIGKGTYGRVYLALNATTGEMIAVKQVEIPRTEHDRDDRRQASVVEALKMESETLKDLDHPNIVQYLGFEQTPDFLSIFLEYVPGGSVAGCLRKHGKFDDQVARSFTAQILAGLEYLHANGIIHRDMKADNILVDPSGICKISDFGISKRTEDININGEHTSMQGSVFWMAPEVVQAASKKGEQHGYNGKVDIWSLGCVVLEMWAGRRPWQNTDAITVIYELITSQQAPPVPDDVHLSREADDFRQKCFAINPDDRPSATELRRHPYLTLQPGWTFQGFK